jgi:hypothetical protein
MILGGGVVVVLFSKKKEEKDEFFSTQTKHKHYHQFEGHIIRVAGIKLFHCIKALLHMVGIQIGVDGVGHGWVVDDKMEFLDLFAFHVSRK